GDDPLRCQWAGFGHIELGHDLVGGVDRRVVQHLGVNKLVGRQVGVGIGHVVGDRGHDFRTQDVVDEGVGVVRVRGILGNGDHVEPQVCTFLLNGVYYVHALFGFRGTGGGLEDVAGVAGGHADFAVGQVGDVPRRVEVCHVAAHAHQQLLGLLQV